MIKLISEIRQEFGSLNTALLLQLPYKSISTMDSAPFITMDSPARHWLTWRAIPTRHRRTGRKQVGASMVDGLGVRMCCVRWLGSPGETILCTMKARLSAISVQPYYNALKCNSSKAAHTISPSSGECETLWYTITLKHYWSTSQRCFHVKWVWPACRHLILRIWGLWNGSNSV